MWVLPSDFALPPEPYLAGLVLAAAAVVLLLLWRRPPVTEGSIAALSPWMAAGGGLYALYQVGAIPHRFAPLFSSPAVYVTVGIAAGTVWAAAGGPAGAGGEGGRDKDPDTDDGDPTDVGEAADESAAVDDSDAPGDEDVKADRGAMAGSGEYDESDDSGAPESDGYVDGADRAPDDVDPAELTADGEPGDAGGRTVGPVPGTGSTAAILAATGTLVLVATLVVAGYWIATAPEGGDSPGGPALSLAILGVTVVLTGIVWAALRRRETVSAVGLVGLLAVFGHVLDGVSTAVGYDLLGFGEQTPLSQLVISLGAAVSPAWAGAGWLFVLVKLALAAGIVVLFESYVRDEPTEGYLLLGMIVGVGLGPGVHNVVLFAIA